MIKRVWGVTFYASDLKKATAFYEKILGLEKKYEYSSYVGFDYGGIEIGLIPKEKIGITEKMPRVEFSVENVDLTFKTFKEKGVKFSREPLDEPWGAREATLSDSDGNLLDVMQINWEKYFNVATKGFKKG
jgi:catechol 2,3-dioxygenase-like lactoylglutathione lyase family enzyme